MFRGAARTIALMSAATVLLAACAVGPDFKVPAAPGVSGYTPEPLTTSTTAAATSGGGAQHFVRALDLPGQWWTLFHSKDLDTLVERALAANPDLAAAQAALIVAKQNVYAQQGLLFPSVDGNFTSTRELAPISPPPTIGAPNPVFNLFTTQLNVSYVPDVFGGTRRSIEALPPRRTRNASRSRRHT